MALGESSLDADSLRHDGFLRIWLSGVSCLGSRFRTCGCTAIWAPNFYIDTPVLWGLDVLFGQRIATEQPAEQAVSDVWRSYIHLCP